MLEQVAQTGFGTSTLRVNIRVNVTLQVKAHLDTTQSILLKLTLLRTPAKLCHSHLSRARL